MVSPALAMAIASAMRPNGLAAVPSPPAPGATYSVDAYVEKGVSAAVTRAPSSARCIVRRFKTIRPPRAGNTCDVRVVCAGPMPWRPGGIPGRSRESTPTWCIIVAAEEWDEEDLDRVRD